ncbi:hypothetical protein Q9Q95_17915 [Sphingomonas sp. DG1-23]|uniref:hypothetical protein n=1 Tax=Sphingomonas sp. DG1-23 TaxID=3068316 RepID=UPI00273D5E03|nr:hypothetical protein [Sphingomonas sp. DG1-23]MDP5280807.1 hypothetical protein [Sphingomonas sp. DG1-23]
MTIETDEQAIARLTIEPPVVHPESFTDFAAAKDVLHIAFFYMRINTNGAFVAERFFHRGTAGQPISPETNPDIPGSLGWYARDMAGYGRIDEPDRDGRYEHLGYGLSGFQFPRRYSYIVFYMDDVHWPYLEDPSGMPIVPFHAEKNGKQYAKHDFAFTKPSKFKIAMTSGGRVTEREALVMINCMRKANGDPFGQDDREEYCFDLVMRVRYAGSTDGLTVIIDPTGENLGPPIP